MSEGVDEMVTAERIVSKEEMKRVLEDRHGRDLQARFTEARVAICGLGGLGSHLAYSLARAGVGRLVLIDFDRVDLTNLHRQQYKADQVGRLKAEALRDNLKEIAPYVGLECYSVELNEQNAADYLKGADIVCEAFDRAEAKAMLANLVLADLPESILVAASGMAGLSSGNRIQTRKISDRFYLCGDEESDVSDGLGLLSSRVMLCAAHQAHMVLRLLAGEKEA